MNLVINLIADSFSSSIIDCFKTILCGCEYYLSFNSLNFRTNDGLINRM